MTFKRYFLCRMQVLLFNKVLYKEQVIKAFREKIVHKQDLKKILFQINFQQIINYLNINVLENLINQKIQDKKIIICVYFKRMKEKNSKLLLSCSKKRV